MYELQPQAVIYLLTRPLCDTESILKCRMQRYLHVDSLMDGYDCELCYFSTNISSGNISITTLTLFTRQRIANSTPKLYTVLY